MNKLIVLEGADGAGKGTQFAELIKVLEYNKTPFATYDFPRYETFWGKNIARFLNGEFGDVASISPYYKTLFYILDQADASKEIKKDLDAGKVVLCNRFTSSNQIFQAAWIDDKDEKQAFLKWLDNAAYGELDIVRPGIVFGLYVDPKVAFENIEKKAAREYTTSKRDENEKNFDLQRKVANELKEMCISNKGWVLIEASEDNKMREVEIIRNEIVEKINNILNIDLKLP